MRGKQKKGLHNHLFGFIIICGVCGGALAFAAGMGVDNFSQLAAGTMADKQCMGGKDAHCPCGKGIDPKTGKCGNVKGGGKIGCPCSDTTSGDVAASGKCATVGKCKADKADGMAPMLPMLPMPMPQMDMPSMTPQNCPQSTSNATTSTSTVNTANTSIGTSGGSVDPNCPPASFGAQSGGNFWGSVWDTVNPFASPDDAAGNETGTGSNGANDGGTANTSSVWGNLLQSLGLSHDSGVGGGDVGTGSGTSVNTSGVTSAGTIASSNTETAATTSTDTMAGYAKAGSTFSYEADPSEFEDATTVLDQIKKTLERLMGIVSGWL